MRIRIYSAFVLIPSFFFFAFIACAFDTAHAAELSGFVAAEARLFSNSPLHQGQKTHNASIAFQPEFYIEWQGGARSVTFVPFARLDSADTERTHFDVRELFGLFVFEDLELGVGIRKVFWGVTESAHLVDIINQTDLVENIDGEDKLGQPMVSLLIPTDAGTIEFFVLPYFRERTFPGRRGRLRTALVVDTDRARFESGADEYNIDLAVRYSHSPGDWDIGLSHFTGTGREPTLLAGTDKVGRPVLIPLYEQINQSGADIQLTLEQWLWKLEAIHRSGQGSKFFALAGGFEYTFVRVSGTNMDLGVVVEYLYDDRGEGAKTPFEDDLMAGLRFVMNDVSGTEVLAGVVQDLSGPARSLFLEASRRLTDHWKATIEGRVFTGLADDDILYSIHDDDHVQIEIAYYF